jgi:hypothetical protein
MPQSSHFLAPLLFAMTLSGEAFAQDGSTAFERLSECQSLTDGAQRLSCYDDRMAALRAAANTGEVVIVERAQVDAARRAVFGFTAPNLPAIFGGDNIEGLETTLDSASAGLNGAWIFHLADGSVWRQIDATRVTNPRGRQGEEVRIRKAAFGSYFLNLGSSRAVRVRRE